MNYTHQKRPYRAQCWQWNGTNTQEIVQLFHDAKIHDENHIMVRHGNRISTLVIGSWIVRGENGQIKCYNNNEFNIKYEALP